MVAGRFGEAFIAQLLAKRGIVDVVQANTEGIDLFAISKKNSFIGKNKIIGISVKTRKNHNGIPLNYKQMQRAAKTWNIVPWVGIVISNDPQFSDAYLLPLKSALMVSSLGNHKKGKDYFLSGSKLRNGNLERYHLTTAIKEISTDPNRNKVES